MNEVSKRKPSPAVSSVPPVPPGLTTADLYRLIEQAREVCNDLDEESAAIPESDGLQKLHNLEHQRHLWAYQEPLAQAASFLKPRDMDDVLAMLKLMDDKAEDLAVNDHEENGFDIKAEMAAMRRMVRGCLPIVAAELGVQLGKGLQSLCDGAFPEVPR
jgi:hypothetical protein